MPPQRQAGLTPEAASRICMDQCRAMCCRGPLILRLTFREVLAFKRHSAALGVALRITEAADGGGWVRFSDHAGEHCPMLDDATSACRIYQDRPQRCRDFPDRPTPGCAISGSS
jgi:Fe-S-cluster containining protein